PDGDEVLLEIEEAKYVPVTGLLQRRPHVNAKVEIDNGADDRGSQIQDDDGIGECRWRHGAKASEERAGSGIHRRPCGERLMGDRAEQGDRYKSMDDQEGGRHVRPPVASSRTVT